MTIQGASASLAGSGKATGADLLRGVAGNSPDEPASAPRRIAPVLGCARRDEEDIA